ncbi:CAAX-protease-like [Tropilaelaps mercedesae]|uniref:CAAX prenyl protease 2 n=1 Tax=Tropilaelaps mercedesae TaxID=418985 RepID=A0A1V9XPM0_9ACAR|nr:CAAX-protease-like [Tropilaelaps mercedesae]
MVYLQLAYCVGISLAFLLVIYVGVDALRRNDPEVAKRRCIRVLCLSLVAPFFVYLVYDPSEYPPGTPFLHVLGIRTDGLLSAACLPILLTALFFLGPIVQHFVVDGYYTLLLEPSYWLVNFGDPLWIRDHLCAPLVEEVCFRACVLPLLFPHLGELGSAIAGPIVFGLCHLHHLRERALQTELRTAIFVTAFQFIYATLFGIFASFIFLRTGHLTPCILVHSFCNYMGVPHLPSEKAWLWPIFIGGVARSLKLLSKILCCVEQNIARATKGLKILIDKRTYSIGPLIKVAGDQL